MMLGPNVCISNLAWPAEADAEALVLSRQLGITGVELAPTKLWGPWQQILPAAVTEYSHRCAEQGLKIPAFQAICYGVVDAQLFGDRNSQYRLREHLVLVTRLAGLIGVDALVYGAPRTRDPGSLEPAAAAEHAAEFFRSLAPVLESEGTSLCIEANHPDWGCRFVTTTDQAVELVEMIGCRSIKVQLDTGTMIAGCEQTDSMLKAMPWAGHFHASEPGLAPLGAIGSDHARLGAALTAGGYHGWRSVEMQASPDWRANLARAAAIMESHYASSS